MTTNRDSVTILGDLIARYIDVVPDEVVLDTVKTQIHDVIERGLGIAEPITDNEKLIWELVASLAPSTCTPIWAVEAALLEMVDQYDLFND